MNCQRWREGRARYRPAGERFDTGRAEVVAIEEGDAKAFTVRHHYAATYPAARFRVGLFVKAGRFLQDELAGVAVFSVPMSQGIIPKWCDVAPDLGVELGRLVLLDSVAANAESWFVARAFRLVRAELQVYGVLSYSDPVERLNAAGELVKRGHVGTVYQALNATYRGRARRRIDILSADGRLISPRALSKLRNDEVGAAYAYEQLRALGAPPRRPLEGGREYAERALREGAFKRAPHPGNHTYTWWLGDRRRRPAWTSLPYPKQEAR